MHEYALAREIVRIVAEHSGGRRVATVELSIGHLRQVVPTALSFGFEIASAGTAAEGAELAIREIPARSRCASCDAITGHDRFPFRCGACGGRDLVIVSGEELTVESLELAREPEPSARPAGSDKIAGT